MDEVWTEVGPFRFKDLIDRKPLANRRAGVQSN